MLHVLFRLGDDAYAISADAVQEILPLVEIRPIGETPPWVSGVVLRHGRLLPVVDLVAHRCGRPAESLISTRILVLDVENAAGEPARIGAVVERMTDTLRRDPAAFESSGIRRTGDRPIGRLAFDDGQLIQRVEVADLVTPEVADALLTLPEAA